MTAVIIRKPDEDPDLMAAILDLRVAAWEPIVGRAIATERFGFDVFDHRSHHLVIPGPSGGPPVAAGRLTPCEQLGDLPDPTSFAPFSDEMIPPLAFAGRLVVHPDHSGEGLAEQIIIARLAAARDLQFHEVWSETRRDQVLGFVRHGYQPMGPSADRSVVGEWEIMRARL